MALLEAVVLGAVQGATEFLPISSSAHLVVVPAVLGFKQPSVAFDVLLHAATLLAVVTYFRRDLWSMVTGAVGELGERKIGKNLKLAFFLAIATVPAAVAGVVFKGWFEALFASPMTAGGFLFVTASVLLLADRFGGNTLGVDDLNGPRAVGVGFAQAAAIAPGISRSGSTISVGMLCGLERREAARFSFLLSIPIIAGTAMFEIKDPAIQQLAAGPAAAGFAAAAAVGYGCIAFLLKYLATHKLRPFAIYCALAGAFTIVFFLLKS